MWDCGRGLVPTFVVRGTDDALYWGRADASTWTGWTPLGGVVLSMPAVVAGP